MLLLTSRNIEKLVVLTYEDTAGWVLCSNWNARKVVLFCRLTQISVEEGGFTHNWNSNKPVLHTCGNTSRMILPSG